MPIAGDQRMWLAAAQREPQNETLSAMSRAFINLHESSATHKRDDSTRLLKRVSSDEVHFTQSWLAQAEICAQLEQGVPRSWPVAENFVSLPRNNRAVHHWYVCLFCGSLSSRPRIPVFPVCFLPLQETVFSFINTYMAILQ